MGKAMLTIMAAFAQLERDTTIERTRAGLAAAAANGRKRGRPRKVADADAADAAKARSLREKGITATDIAKTLRVPRHRVPLPLRWCVARDVTRAPCRQAPRRWWYHRSQRIPALTVPSATRPGLQSRDDLGAHGRAARLARVVAQRAVDELHGPRHLVAGDSLAQELSHRRLVEGCGLGASGGLHEGIRHLTESLVGHADDEAGQHIRVGGQGRLDLRRVHVAAADSEHVDPTVAQIQETVLVEVAEIAERIHPSRVLAVAPM